MYSCKRCNYETTLKANLLIHLKTNKECPALYENIERDRLIEEIENSKRNKKGREKNFCAVCNKEFNSKYTYDRHKEHCTITHDVYNFDISQLQVQVNELQEGNRKLHEKYISIEQQLQESQSQIADLRKIVNNMIRVGSSSNTLDSNTGSIVNSGKINNCSVINNVNYNITLRNFGDENMDALLDSEIGDCFLNLQFKDMVEQLHYNNEYPENNNVRIKSIKRKMMEIYEQNKWNLTSFKEGLPKLVIQIQKIFEDYAKRNKESIKDEMTKDELIANLDALNRIKNLDKQLINPIIRDLEHLLEAKRNSTTPSLNSATQ